uniref:MIP18 family-like domain-containing protein n=1 Tax=mine drainage metagenome TaxID=410659 RepID=E6QIN1_9ZZZZ
MAGARLQALPALTVEDIYAALRDCFDPEVKLNLVDLGLIYDVAIEADPHAAPSFPRQRVKVRMTLTTPQCPASGLIFEQVHNRLAAIQQVSRAEVDLVWEPKWTAHRISAAGRAQLGL